MVFLISNVHFRPGNWKKQVFQVALLGVTGAAPALGQSTAPVAPDTTQRGVALQEVVLRGWRKAFCSRR